MPRATPASRAKKEAAAAYAATLAPLKFTAGFPVIGFLNGKNVAANFVKQDAQSWWSRRSNEEQWEEEREGKRLRMMEHEEGVEAERAALAAKGPEAGKLSINVLTGAPAGSVKPAQLPKPVDPAEADAPFDPMTKTIIIHPGSRWLRIGRASDAFPITIPYAIARRSKTWVPGTTSADKGKQRVRYAPPTASAPAPVASVPTQPSRNDDMDVDDDASDDEPTVDPSVPMDPLSAKISSIRGDLRARMRSFKLRGQGNGNSQAIAYNQTVQPERTADYNDPNEIEWTDVSGPDRKEFYVGSEALKIPNAAASGYVLRHPYDRGNFNTADYTSKMELLGDIEQIWMSTLEFELEIEKSELKDYSAILLIPDLYDHIYVREMTDLCLKGIGFKQLCIQQEGICASFGAGISNACVIDIGAKKTSVSCIEEGIIIAESRMSLDFAGDDITEFLNTLLFRTGFPYREIDLNRWTDFTMMEDLKEKMVVLSESDVGLNMYDFYVRNPGKPTRKYTFRSYDDVILAPYSLFAPRIVDFEGKVIPQPQLWSKTIDDIVDIGGNATTNAMKASTRHLLPAVIRDPSIPTAPAAPEGVPAALVATAALLEASAEPVSLPGTKAPTRATTPAKAPGPELDVKLEASKIPLHVAVVESIIACGTEDRMKKVCSNVLIVGGTALIHNIGFAIESRVSPALVARVPALSGHFAIVPAPREIDPRELAWKGISTLSKLDVANELWIRREDWEALGMRAVRERAFFFA